MPKLPKITKIGNAFAHRFLLRFAVSTFILARFISATAQTDAQSSISAITDPAQIISKEKFDVQPISMEKLFMSYIISDSSLSPDGKQVAFISNMSGRRNLWLVSSQSGWPTQLTVSNQRQISPAWSPKGRWIVYASDNDGNELYDLSLVSSTNGQVVNLTNSPEISEESPLWSPDGEKIAYSVKPKEASNHEVDVMEIETRKVTHITQNTPKAYSNSVAAWSHDGKWLVVNQRAISSKDGNILIVNSITGQAINLTPHKGEQRFSASDISPDAKTILLSSNSGNGYDNAALLDITTKKLTWLTTDKWEVTSGKFSPDGKRLTWMANVDGNGDLLIYDLNTRQTQTLAAGSGINTLDGSAQSPFSPDGTHLLYTHFGPNVPTGLWLYDITARKSHQITHSFSGGLRSEDMVEPYLVHYPSKDGKWQISAFVYVPYNAQRNGKNAAVVFIHGGPEAQLQNFIVRPIQYLVNQGYFVIAPNYRGSSGYGKEFQDANRFDLGGGDLDDVISAADWMVKTGYVDTKKIAVIGGSYGGYLTMMAVTKAPERFAAGVPWIPFVNWFTVFENTSPELREFILANMGDPNKDVARFKDRSPIYFVDQIKAPLLLLAGGNDPRCPRTEAEQVAQAVKKRGGIVDLKIYENEGHGFTKIENLIDSYTRIAEFLKKYVPPEKCGCNIND
ncbi:MAG TPA: S9 family peptidase [Candidatus Angelobacter sp.]|jgi:dipeptidyl aminopeptidase/acylaminoacyl peptidase